jgi:hypothetical protein
MAKWKECWARTSQDPASFSKHFLQRLYRFDQGRIRIRWSPFQARWLIERKYSAGKYEPTITPYWPNGMLKDEWVQARDGYITIDALPPHTPIESVLLSNLQYFNLERWGGARYFTEYVQEQEDKAQRAKAQAQSDRWYNMTSEYYMPIKRELGEVEFIPREAQGVPTKEVPHGSDGVGL